MKSVIIFGAKGVGKVVLDILQKNEWLVYGFLDDDKAWQGAKINDVPVLGTMQDKQFLSLLGAECVAFVAIEEIQRRKAITSQLTKGATTQLINAIHPHTSLAQEIQLGEGNLIHVGTSLGPGVTIGNGCMINGHCMLAHDVVIDDFVHIGAGTLIQAGVNIASGACIGMGSILLPKIKIGQGVYVKPGTLVEKDIT